MADVQGEKTLPGSEISERERIAMLVSRHVLKALGRPTDFREVQVRALWGHRYRVNVVVGSDVASSQIANSFFIVLDGAGQVLQTTPEIHRQYELQ